MIFFNPSQKQTENILPHTTTKLLKVSCRKATEFVWFALNPKISTWTDSKRWSLAFQCLALAYLKKPVTRIFQHLYSLSTTCYFCQTFLVPQKLLLAVDPLHGLPISLGFQMSTHKRHYLTK